MACQVDADLDPRVRRTRKLLQDAFSALLREKEFADISVQDIAARATVNRATFYAHYTDKNELAIAVLRTHLHTILFQQFDERPPLTPENMVRIAVGVFQFFADMQDSCPKTSNAIQAAAGTALQEDLYEVMHSWLSSSPNFARLFPGSSKETVATVLSGSIYSGAQRWSRAKKRSSVETVCQEILSVILPGAGIARALELNKLNKQ